jgi:kynurenine formamidase
MSCRFLKVQSVVVGCTLSIAMLLFAAQHHDAGPGSQFRTVIDMSAPTLAGKTVMVSPAKLGGAWSVDQVPPVRLVGQLAIVEAEHKNFANSEALVTMDDVAGYERAHGAIPQGAIVLLTSTRPNIVPEFSSDALHFLVEARNVVGIGGAGAETVSPDQNAYLAKNGIYELNNVTNLSIAPRSGALAIAAPVKAERATESPVRLMALVR